MAIWHPARFWLDTDGCLVAGEEGPELMNWPALMVNPTGIYPSQTTLGQLDAGCYWWDEKLNPQCWAPNFYQCLTCCCMPQKCGIPDEVVLTMSGFDGTLTSIDATSDQGYVASAIVDCTQFYQKNGGGRDAEYDCFVQPPHTVKPIWHVSGSCCPPTGCCDRFRDNYFWWPRDSFRGEDSTGADLCTIDRPICRLFPSLCDGTPQPIGYGGKNPPRWIPTCESCCDWGWFFWGDPETRTNKKTIVGAADCTGQGTSFEDWYKLYEEFQINDLDTGQTYDTLKFRFRDPIWAAIARDTHIWPPGYCGFTAQNLVPLDFAFWNEWHIDTQGWTRSPFYESCWGSYWTADFWRTFGNMDPRDDAQYNAWCDRVARDYSQPNGQVSWRYQRPEIVLISQPSVENCFSCWGSSINVLNGSTDGHCRGTCNVNMKDFNRTTVLRAAIYLQPPQFRVTVNRTRSKPETEPRLLDAELLYNVEAPVIPWAFEIDYPCEPRGPFGCNLNPGIVQPRLKAFYAGSAGYGAKIDFAARIYCGPTTLLKGYGPIFNGSWWYIDDVWIGEPDEEFPEPKGLGYSVGDRFYFNYYESPLRGGETYWPTENGVFLQECRVAAVSEAGEILKLELVLHVPRLADGTVPTYPEDGETEEEFAAGELDSNVEKTKITLRDAAIDHSVAALMFSSFSTYFNALVTPEQNKNPPVFTSGATGNIAENESDLMPIYFAQTTDADRTPINRQVRYAIKENMGDAADVVVDPITGVVRLRHPADFETKTSYTFTVVAVNEGADKILFAEKVVTVTVTDKNDNAPVFVSSVEVDIESCVPPGTPVYQTITTDADATPENRDEVVYSIKENVEDGWRFSIDDNGLVTINEQTDQRRRPSYKFVVVAKNPGTDVEQVSERLVTLYVQPPRVFNPITEEWELVDEPCPPLPEPETEEMRAAPELPTMRQEEAVPPKLVAGNKPIVYIAKKPAVLVAPDIKIETEDYTTIIGATVTIGDVRDGDELLLGPFFLVGNIEGSWDAATGLFTFSGPGTRDQYETALRALRYQFNDIDPTFDGEREELTLSWQVTAKDFTQDGVGPIILNLGCGQFFRKYRPPLYARVLNHRLSVAVPGNGYREGDTLRWEPVNMPPTGQILTGNKWYPYYNATASIRRFARATIVEVDSRGGIVDWHMCGAENQLWFGSHAYNPAEADGVGFWPSDFSSEWYVDKYDFACQGQIDTGDYYDIGYANKCDYMYVGYIPIRYSWSGMGDLLSRSFQGNCEHAFAEMFFSIEQVSVKTSISVAPPIQKNGTQARLRVIGVAENMTYPPPGFENPELPQRSFTYTGDDANETCTITPIYYHNFEEAPSYSAEVDAFSEESCTRFYKRHPIPVPQGSITLPTHIKIEDPGSGYINDDGTFPELSTMNGAISLKNVCDDMRAYLSGKYGFPSRCEFRVSEFTPDGGIAELEILWPGYWYFAHDHDDVWFHTVGSNWYFELAWPTRSTNPLYEDPSPDCRVELTVNSPCCHATRDNWGKLHHFDGFPEPFPSSMYRYVTERTVNDPEAPPWEWGTTAAQFRTTYSWYECAFGYGGFPRAQTYLTANPGFDLCGDAKKRWSTKFCPDIGGTWKMLLVHPCAACAKDQNLQGGQTCFNPCGWGNSNYSTDWGIPLSTGVGFWGYGGGAFQWRGTGQAWISRLGGELTCTVDWDKSKIPPLGVPGDV